MNKTAVLFGSTTGNTEQVAEKIANKIGSNVDILNVADLSCSDIQEYQNLILGSSTWGIGDLQDDWENFLTDLSGLSLKDKKVALFGLGDSLSYPDSFVDAMGTIYEEIKNNGGEIIGQVAADEYSFDDSKAIYDGKFIGLPIDEDNEGDLTDTRIENWVNAFLDDLNSN